MAADGKIVNRKNHLTADTFSVN
ncbi:CLUMA_CG017703, isoform A [Clunio marinus]|uniref:CLUMA_CG017703, isoform A n=1 Tax=Clunio marinus TaxID=568069 RepID=A0A1J1IY47_9DIPT|nr:CLUMA_CG017703, isoform A [Clunio marinus]